MTDPVKLPRSLHGRWRLGPELGKGGQGRVYLLHSLTGGPDAVMKVMLALNDYSLERFRREVEALASMTHPNVMCVLEHELEPTAYYVAPKGQPLDTYWTKVREKAETVELFERSAAMIEGLAHGLAAVHERNLVHRDIKPQNVIIMDFDRAVLADFGIVHVPDAERITTRPAGNRFARDLASIYDLSLAPPAGDCLGLASLWAWLLAAGPHLQHGNYHWRFHKFIPDPRCEIARAVLAICSEPAACPKDGAAFVDMLQKRFSVPRLSSSAAGDVPIRAYSLAAAQRDLQKVAVRSETEVVALAITPHLERLVTTLRESARSLKSQGVPHQLHVTGLSDPLVPDNVVQAVLNSEQEGLAFMLAYLRCGDDNVEDFGVELLIEWHRHPHEDRSKFSIHVQFVHEGGPHVASALSGYFKVLPNGDIPDLDVNMIAGRIVKFFNDESVWRPRTKPRVRPPGSFLG